MYSMFLGQPHESIVSWINGHPYVPPTPPASHSETRFTLEGGTVETYNITGALDQQWMIDNGFFDENNYEWIKTITQADIGNTVTSIRSGAFASCSGLTTVTIGNGVTSIGYMAFNDCSGLTTVTIGNDVASIGENVFSGCSGLTNVTIPSSVTSIGSQAFYNCRGLTSVTIPDSVTSIGSYAFEKCSGLTSVTFNNLIKNQVKSLTTGDSYIFGEFFVNDNWNLIEKSFTAICTDGSMTIHFSADDPAIITITDL